MNRRQLRNCAGAVIAVVVFTAIVLSCYPFPVAGTEIIDCIPVGDICRVVLEKTLEDGSGTQTAGRCQLDEAQRGALFALLKESVFRKDTILMSDGITSAVRYSLSMENAQGHTVCTMKFYNSQWVVFDYKPGEAEPVHNRYRQVSEQLLDFFEKQLTQ